MSSESFRLDPEVEAILKEVASDPSSALLRVPRKKAMPALLEERPAVGIATAGLSIAERELVRVHKNEVAWLLREACFHKLLEGPKSKGLVTRFPTDGRVTHTLSPAEVRERTAAEREGFGLRDDTENAFELLDRCVQDPLGDEPTTSRLAAASFRLAPTDQARLLAGAGFAFEHGPMAAIRLMGVVLSRPSTKVVACSAWSTTGMAYDVCGNDVKAYQAYRAACCVREQALPPVLCRLRLAVQVGNIDDVRACSRSLDVISESEWLVVESIAALQERRIENGTWKPSSVGRQVAITVRSELGKAGQRIVDAFKL